MRLKLFLLLLVLAVVPVSAQQTGLQGVVVDAGNGLPVSGASILLEGQGKSVTAGPSGDFLISDATPGTDKLHIMAYGYDDFVMEVNIIMNVVDDLGEIRIEPEEVSFLESEDFLLLDESQIEDEEGNDQSIGMLTGASD